MDGRSPLCANIERVFNEISNGLPHSVWLLA